MDVTGSIGIYSKILSSPSANPIENWRVIAIHRLLTSMEVLRKNCYGLENYSRARIHTLAGTIHYLTKEE
jgi:hypothetical protein